MADHTRAAFTAAVGRCLGGDDRTIVRHYVLMAIDQGLRWTTPRAGWLVGLGWVIYQQVAAAIGAIAMLAIVRTLFNLDVHGFVAMLADYWDGHVRPAGSGVLDVVVTQPVWIVADRVVSVPPWLQDYLAVGLMFSLLMIRGLRATKFHRLDDYPIAETMFYLTAGLLLWPLLTIVWVLDIPEDWRARRTTNAYNKEMQERFPARFRPARPAPIMGLMALTPLAYLALLLALDIVISH